MSEQLDKRYELSMTEYEKLLVDSNALKFGTRNLVLDTSFVSAARSVQQQDVLFLKEIKEFHREYEWIS